MTKAEGRGAHSVCGALVDLVFLDGRVVLEIGGRGSWVDSEYKK